MLLFVYSEYRICLSSRLGASFFSFCITISAILLYLSLIHISEPTRP